MENFIGKDNFVWFIGVVENRADPLGMGRCQLRIFGWHTDNISKLPTKDLPWAQPMYPINNPRAFSAPRLNDWVVGFFMDGLSGQAPIMMGVLPGLAPEKPKVISATEKNAEISQQYNEAGQVNESGQGLF